MRNWVATMPIPGIPQRPPRKRKKATKSSMTPRERAEGKRKGVLMNAGDYGEKQRKRRSKSASRKSLKEFRKSNRKLDTKWRGMLVEMGRLLGSCLTPLSEDQEGVQ